MHRDAVISDCGTLRWLLHRVWSPGPRVLWIMLNPGTADAREDDPTVDRCVHFARHWGFGGLRVVNAYPFRSSSVSECRMWASDPEIWRPNGPMDCNLRLIANEARGADLVIGGWDAIAWDPTCTAKVIYAVGRDIYCLGTAQNGAPKHPMARGEHRVPDDQMPMLWQPKSPTRAV